MNAILIERVYLLPFRILLDHVGAERRTSLDQLQAMIPKNMIYSADQIRLSNTIAWTGYGYTFNVI